MSTNAKRRVTIDRGKVEYELTVVGRTGQKHVHQTNKKGKDGHFTSEGQYRRTIDRFVRLNKPS